MPAGPLLLALALGCRTPAASSAPSPSGQSVSTPASATATTGDTAGPPTPRPLDTERDWTVPLGPATIIDEPGAVQLGHHLGALPQPQGPDLLLVDLRTDDLDQTVPLAVPLDRPHRSVTELWDGVTTAPYALTLAPDHDGDGVDEMWCLGQRQPAELTAAGCPSATPSAWLADGPEPVVITHLDFDGDGHLDLLVEAGSKHIVHFGPIEGELPHWLDRQGDVAQITDFGSEFAMFAAFLPDHFGPGHHGLVTEEQHQHSNIAIYDLAEVRPGATIEPRALLTSAGWSSDRASPVRDLDGDGDSEVFYLDTVYMGPAEGIAETPTFSVVGGSIRGVLGDLDGDGGDELLGYAEADGSVWVMWSPHRFPLDPTAGTPIALPADPIEALREENLVHGDFDDDGTLDLAYGIGQPYFDLDPPDEVHVFSGYDLQSAWASRQAQR